MYRSLAARNPRDHLPQLLHRGGAAYETRTADVGGRGVDLSTITEADRTAHELAQNSQIEWLRDEIKRAQLERADGGFNIAVRGDHGDGQRGAVLLDPGDQVETVPIRKSHVGQA